MKILDILRERKRGVSFEFFPPKTEAGKAPLERTVRTLKAYRPLYVSMTCGAGGSAQERTRGAVHQLLKEGGLVVMPHVTCVGQKKSTIRALLDEYQAHGIENLMLLRGDPPKGAPDFDFSIQEFRYALELVRVARAYGHFCIGVAVYPEGHIETATLKEDLTYAKQKIDAGADFAVTQMFFDNSYYYAYLDRARKAGMTIPILPGILPLTDAAKVKQFASVCRATIPKQIEEAMERHRESPEEMEKVGLEFTIRQCRDLIQNGVTQLHFYTLNRGRATQTVLDAIAL